MKKNLTVLIIFMILIILSACSGIQFDAAPTAIQSTNTSIPTVVNKPTLTNTATIRTSAAPTPTVEAAAQVKKVNEDGEDYVWDPATVIPIVLNGNSINASSPNIKIEGKKVTITSAGTYSLSGSMADGQILVNTEEKEIVRLILNSVDLRNSSTAPIYIVKAEKTILVLAENTKNTISDGKSYVFEVPGEDEPNAAVFSKADLTIFGKGELVVHGNFNDGIASKDGLLIQSGTLTVNAVDDGIRGKDYVVVKNGNITINAKGDGLKSDDAEDTTRGYILVENGVLNITAGADAVTAQSNVVIKDGKFAISSGGGSSARLDQNTSAKGIKASHKLTIDGGTFTINSADDALNTNGSMTINGGEFTISTGDDGMHADSTLVINGGDIRIAKSYEGIESAVITINAGDIQIVSSDDGLNVAGGKDGSGAAPGARPGRGPGQDTFTYTGKYFLYIHGGNIVVESVGDGIDVNGAIEMTGGVVIVNGPTVRMNSAVDYDAYFVMKGGFLVAAGSSGMAQAPGESSSQNSILINLSSTQKAGTLFRIQNSQGVNLLTFSPKKDYQSIAFSSPDLVKGGTYDIYTGGKSTGAVKDGLYQGGAYSPGTKYSNFTITSILTRIGASSR